jgi:hypothetical protein
VSTAVATTMQSTGLLTPALRSRVAGTRKQASPTKPALAARTKPSACRRVLRLAVVLAGCFVLVVSLVDPLRGSDRFDLHPATQHQGARHE